MDLFNDFITFQCLDVEPGLDGKIAIPVNSIKAVMPGKELGSCHILCILGENQPGMMQPIKGGVTATLKRIAEFKREQWNAEISTAEMEGDGNLAPFLSPFYDGYASANQELTEAGSCDGGGCCEGVTPPANATNDPTASIIVEA